MRKHPESKDVFKLVEIFKSLGPRFLKKEGAVDMDCPEVQIGDSEEGHKHECGTIHCHAGWYQVAMMERDGRVGNGCVYNYEDGAHAIAKQLDFCGKFHLERWAKRFPEIWGNFYGKHMFSSKEAFGLMVDEQITGQRIVDHWKKIAEKLEEKEKQENR